jgi:beta-ureidopropionase / N-carbamoyl-L-amino-acid hydrolase
MEHLRINSDRLWQSLMSLAAIGATSKGGVCRLALTDLDRQGRDLVKQWCEQAGCQVRVDAIGNIFARREGSNSKRLPVATGSHIDTQPTGGKFDGNYGVLAGIEVIRTLNDHQIQTEALIEVCVWTNEEGSRFVPVMMGSGVFAGAFTLEHALAAKDRDNISVAQALAAIGYQGLLPASVNTGASSFSAYFETHIEQGPVLENANIPIGVVMGALGQRWYDVTVTGQEAHAGPTPMALRRDALQTALPLMAKVREIALADQPHSRGTVGYVSVFPNSRNVIPGKVTFTVDFRHQNDEGLMLMDQAIRQACAEAAAQGAFTISIEQTVYFAPTHFDDTVVNVIRNTAMALGHESMDIVSGAGHDAVYVARVCPSAMIFIPCKDGISHNEIEDALPEHIEAGANVLLQSMLRIAA